MLSIFSIMRDFYDGSYDARKQTLCTKKKKKMDQPTAVNY